MKSRRAKRTQEVQGVVQSAESSTTEEVPVAKRPKQQVVVEVEEPHVSGDDLLCHLHAFSLALGDVEKWGVLRDAYYPGLAANGAHGHAVVAAESFVNAGALKSPHADLDLALNLVEELFTPQERHGFMCLGPEPDRQQFLTTAYGHAWDAAMAAILYVAHTRNYPGVMAQAQRWWRQYLDLLWLLPSGAKWPSGAPIILSPCMHGGSGEHPEKAICRDRDEIAGFVQYGIHAPLDEDDPNLTGIRLFQAMESVPLPHVENPFPMPATLVVRRGSAGQYAFLRGEGSGKDTWAAGTTLAPETSFELPGGWAECAPVLEPGQPFATEIVMPKSTGREA